MVSSSALEFPRPILPFVADRKTSGNSLLLWSYHGFLTWLVIYSGTASGNAVNVKELDNNKINW